jgi:hypothetical protein
MADTGSEDLNLWQQKVDKVKEEEISRPGMPLKHYLQECMLSFKRFESYKSALAAGGMDFKAVAGVEPLIDGSRVLLSQTSMITFPNPESQQAWENGKEEAEYLLYDLKAAMDYAFRDHPGLLAQVSVIREGASNPDLIQDLSDASVLAKANAALLEAVGYDMANADRAASLAKSLSGLLAQATLDKSVAPGQTLLRDKWFHVLKQTIDKLNDQAIFIMRADKKKASEFRINPPRRKAAKKTDAAPATA